MYPQDWCSFILIYRVPGTQVTQATQQKRTSSYFAWWQLVRGAEWLPSSPRSGCSATGDSSNAATEIATEKLRKPHVSRVTSKRHVGFGIGGGPLRGQNRGQHRIKKNPVCRGCWKPRSRLHIPGFQNKKPVFCSIISYFVFFFCILGHPSTLKQACSHEQR